MAISTVKLLHVLALTVDLPEYNLWRGQVGTVVEELASGAAFEVEFSGLLAPALRYRNGHPLYSQQPKPRKPPEITGVDSGTI
jgi:hypothetical protein